MYPMTTLRMSLVAAIPWLLQRRAATPSRSFCYAVAELAVTANELSENHKSF